MKANHFSKGWFWRTRTNMGIHLAEGSGLKSLDRFSFIKARPGLGLSSRVRSLALYKDYRRYRATGARNALAVIALTQGFWASAVFRLSHWAITRFRAPGLRVIVKASCLLLQKLVEIATGISIPAACSIGAGLYIGHFGGIFIDSHSRIGKNCNLSQGVTIGKGGRGALQGVPLVGDRVHVGANALILGKITIGSDAVIGPGAVVMNSVPPCAVVVGNPARVVALAGSFDVVKYDDMENDPARQLAVQNQRCGKLSTGTKGQHGTSD